MSVTKFWNINAVGAGHSGEIGDPYSNVDIFFPTLILDTIMDDLILKVEGQGEYNQNSSVSQQLLYRNNPTFGFVIEPKDFNNPPRLKINYNINGGVMEANFLYADTGSNQCIVRNMLWQLNITGVPTLNNATFIRIGGNAAPQVTIENNFFILTSTVQPIIIKVMEILCKSADSNVTIKGNSFINKSGFVGSAGQDMAFRLRSEVGGG